MTFKKSLLIICLIICIFTMVSVSATDVNDTAMYSEDNIQVELSSRSDEILIEDDFETNEEDFSLIKTTNEEIISEQSNGTFTDLQNMIDSYDGTPIKLEKDYYYNDGFDTNGIRISKSITIDGQGHKIDARHAARIFFIDYQPEGGWDASDMGISKYSTIDGQGNQIDERLKATISNGALGYGGSTVELINITFVNGNASEGAAIYFEDYVFVIASDCVFVNNTANLGGAIRHNDGTDSKADYEFHDCVFVNNTANLGGAICFESFKSRVFSDCVFVNNSAETGGAIYLLSTEGVVHDCVFVNNNATNGVIYFKYKSQVWEPAADFKVNNNIFLNHDKGSEISFDSYSAKSNIDYNWFDEYVDEQPSFNNLNASIWLFLDATVNSNSIPVFTTLDIVFNLYAYNKTFGDIFEYDNALFKQVNLTVSSINGVVDKSVVGLGESVKYTADNSGTGSVTALIENIEMCTIKIDILKLNPDLTVGEQIIDYGQNATITIIYNNISTGKVNIALNGKKRSINYLNMDLNPVIVLPNDIPVDDYKVVVTYSGDGNFLNATADGNLTVNKVGTEIKVDSITTTYNIKRNLVITLKDGNGKVLRGVKITVKLNGTKTYTTDKNGQIKINVAKIVPKTYTAKLTFEGNANYLKSTADVKVTVKKAKPKITAKKKTYKLKSKNKKFTITLKDNKGKAIKKAKVTIKVIKIKKSSKKKKSKKAGKKNILKAKTNKKGKATFKINRKSKGKYQVIIKYKGNKYYKSATKKVKITIK